MENEKKIRKILLVEENEVMRFYFRDAFWLHGGQYNYEVSFANDAALAGQIIEDPKSLYDLVFIDVELHIQHKSRTVLDPEGCVKLISAIRRQPHWDQATVVIFAAPAYFGIWKKAKQAGANYVLKKSEFLPFHLVDWTSQIFNKKA